MAHQYLDAFFSGDGDLRVLTACPFCNTSYSIRAARVLAQKDDGHVIHIECRSCGGSIVALILAGSIGVQSVGVVTDLTRHEVEKFSRDLPVTQDDVLDLYRLLQADAPFELLLNSHSPH
jgi:transcription elongation factor Elf1